MYTNIGKKIKGLAIALFILETIGAFITGFILMLLDEDLILSGFLTIVITPLAAWIGSWLLYGFGELIDKICDIERNTRVRGSEKKSEVQTRIDDVRISKLEKLRAQGLITEEEYQQAVTNGQ